MVTAFEFAIFTEQDIHNSQAACRKENINVTFLLVCERRAYWTLSFSAHQY